MRFSNFDEFLRCYSTMKETRRCRLNQGVWTLQCSLTRESEFSGIGCTGKSGLPGVADTGVACTEKCRQFCSYKSSTVQATQGSLDSSVQATPGSLGSPVWATPAILDSPVKHTPVSHQSELQDLLVLLEEQFIKKQTVGVIYWLLGDSCFKKFLT